MGTETSTSPGHRFDDERARKRAARVAGMFDRIVPTYDLLNHLLSGNQDVRWRRRAVEVLALSGTERVVDLCAGTGDLSAALLEGGAAEVVGCDFSSGMVERARRKWGDRIHFDVADATRLPYPDASFDVATVAFGLRNLADRDAGLAEWARVLRPGGRLLVLEFSRPPNAIIRAIYHTYFLVVLPIVGNLVSGGADNAYAYLPRSVLAFPGPQALSKRILAGGFAHVDVRPLTWGIATIHVAVR